MVREAAAGLARTLGLGLAAELELPLMMSRLRPSKLPRLVREGLPGCQGMSEADHLVMK